MLDIKLFLQTWKRYFQGLGQMLTCFQIYIFPLHSLRVIQIYIVVYFSTGFLLNTYGFPVLAISKAETAITVILFLLPLCKNFLGQLGMGMFLHAFKENKKQKQYKKKEEKSVVQEINFC